MLAGLSLEVRAGIVTGLLGPSGSGKTTLIRSIVGVQVVESGTVTVLGLPAGSAALRPRIAYVTQAPSVYGDLSVRENLRYFAAVVRAPASRIDESLALVGLTDHADAVVATLSGGQRSRASLAAALLGEPEVLVLDEPTVGLDPLLRRDLWATFHRIAEAGSTLLVSTHVLDEADRCDELVLLQDGRVIATGAPAAVRAEAGAHDLEEAFIRLAERA